MGDTLSTIVTPPNPPPPPQKKKKTKNQQQLTSQIKNDVQALSRPAHKAKSSATQTWWRHQPKQYQPKEGTTVNFSLCDLQVSMLLLGRLKNNVSYLSVSCTPCDCPLSHFLPNTTKAPHTFTYSLVTVLSPTFLQTPPKAPHTFTYSLVTVLSPTFLQTPPKAPHTFTYSLVTVLSPTFL